MTIYKYCLELKNLQAVQIPRGAKLLSVQIQRGNLCVWALVDPGMPTENRLISVHGTGHPLSDDDHGTFLGTVQMAGGDLVWHVFDRGVAAN
jgi:hypothetical protein